MGRQAFEPACIFHLMSDRYICGDKLGLGINELGPPCGGPYIKLA
jgi:hypothetical protein